MDLSTNSVQDVNITVAAPPAVAITVPAVVTVDMPITGVGGIKGDKGDKGDAGSPGTPGTTDYNALSNKPTIPTTTSQLTNNSGFLTSYTETDPVFIASPAHNITSTHITTLGNTSGTNTGDETSTTIKTKLGISTLSGSNTGDQDLSSYATTSALTSGLAGRQATLVSGTNIKTINGTSLLGSGDITISSGGSGTVSSVSVTTANGVSGTVSNSTTTPTISLSLGAITPVSVVASGTITASNISGTNTGDQTIPTTLPPSGAASGDLSGSYPSPTVTKINGTSLAGLATGILKNTTSTGTPSIAVAADFPTLNQSTTGTASTITGTISETQVTNLTSDLAAKLSNITGLVTAGSNVTITGSGTSASPYAIAATTGGSSSSSGYIVLASSYSAVGNGTTDDTTALQNALNALDTKGYGVLDLEGRTYATGKLSLKPNTGIINGTLLQKASANDYVVSLDGSSGRYQERWLLQNLIIDCNSSNNTTTAGGVISYATGAIYDRPLISNVKIKNVRTKAIYFTGNGTTQTIQPRLEFVTIDGPSILSGSEGIYFDTKVYDPSLLGIDVGRLDVGIELNGNAKVRFTDVRAWGNKSVGLKMTNVTDFVGVNCEFDKNYGHGVYAYTSTRVHFVGSAFSNNSYTDPSNEFGNGTSVSTSNLYDGLALDSTSEVFASACRFVNEATAYQRYGISSNGGSTAYYDGLTKFNNLATGSYAGTVKSAQNMTRSEFNNGAAIDPQTSTRLNLGFYSNQGAGMEIYATADATKPGYYNFVYGGASATGAVNMVQSDGTTFTNTWTVDATGNTTQTGTATVGTPTATGHATTKTYVDTALATKVTGTMKLAQGTTAPSSPSTGDLWVDTN